MEELAKVDYGDAANRPFLMADNDRDKDEGDLDNRDLSFRLCAVRETFEEAGLYLHHPQSKQVSHDFLVEHRPKVDKDPFAMLEMCCESQTAPDVGGLHELSCWLTPLGREDTGGRRFDTIFYTYFLEEERLTSADQTEVTNLVWTDPKSIMEEAKKGELWLAPPQIYELRRLQQVRSFDKLKLGCEAFAKKRILPSWLPTLYKLKDCLVSILPGDELYPQDPDYAGERWEGKFPKLDMTLEEANAKHGGRMNRIGILSASDVRVFVSPDIERELSLVT